MGLDASTYSTRDQAYAMCEKHLISQQNGQAHRKMCSLCKILQNDNFSCGPWKHYHHACELIVTPSTTVHFARGWKLVICFCLVLLTVRTSSNIFIESHPSKVLRFIFLLFPSIINVMIHHTTHSIFYLMISVTFRARMPLKKLEILAQRQNQI